MNLVNVVFEMRLDEKRKKEKKMKRRGRRREGGKGRTGEITFVTGR
jgi:hypothetical protein